MIDYLKISKPFVSMILRTAQDLVILTLVVAIIIPSNYALFNPFPISNNTIIPVTIRLDPAHYLHGKGYIATGTNITATAEIEDSRFPNSSLTYQWFNKNGTIPNDNSTSSITYRFDEPEEDNFLRVLVAHKPNDTGVSQKNLIIRNPVQLINPIGKTNIEHGELIKLTFMFNGTGPFNYCHKFCYESDHEGCERCNLNISTTFNQVNITHYLHNVGNYSLLFTVDNIASQQEKRLTIRISETIKRQTIPYVPIIASISAVFILLIGVGLHMKFKRTVFMETADFDFTRTAYYDEDDWDQEQSFFQRVRILFSSDESDQGNLLNTSLSDSRIRLF